MTQQMLAIWCLVPLPFLNPAWTSGSLWFMYCWSLAWRISSITLLVSEKNAIVQYFEHSLALPFFGIGMKTHLFQSCSHCYIFQICWHIECSTLTASYFRIPSGFCWNSIWILDCLWGSLSPHTLKGCLYPFSSPPHRRVTSGIKTNPWWPMLMSCSGMIRNGRRGKECCRWSLSMWPLEQ